MTFLAIDGDQLEVCFDKEPFVFRHGLDGHPLLSVESLVALARSLPESQVEHQSGDLPVGVDPRAAPKPRCSLEVTLRGMERSGAWVALKNVERQPAYAALLHRCLEEIAGPGAALRRGMQDAQAFVFLSSPHAVTPYHIDPEHNFLLQIRGRKTVYQWSREDRTVLSEEELERFYSGAHRNLTYREEVSCRAKRFELEPGAGLHFPVTAPHWVSNGPAVSVSFSVTFRTPQSERRELLYRMNGRLRALGLSPSPPGRSVVRDGMKYALVRAARRARRGLSRRRRELPSPSLQG